MMPFTLDTYDRKYLEGMCALHNEQTAAIRHIAPLTPDLFLQLVEPKSYFDPAGLFVAHNAGRVLGWVHACITAGTEPWQKSPDLRHRIRMLLFPVDRLDIGRALVDEATAWLKKATPAPTFIEAMHCDWGYPFYRGLWAGGEPICPAALAHVHVALACAGYKNTHESVFLSGSIPAAPAPFAAGEKIELVDSVTEMTHETMKHSWTGFSPMFAKAILAGETVGTIGWVILPHCSRLGAPVFNIWTMGVSEKVRRKGIASALMAHTMRQGYQRGARFCSLGTQVWNAPAQGLYARFGFHSDMILTARTLDLAPPATP